MPSGTRPVGLVKLLCAVTSALALFAGLLTVSPPAEASPTPPADQADSDRALQRKAKPDVLRTLEGNRSTDFYVRFQPRADLSRAYEIEDWGKRGAYVVEKLRATAEDSQAKARKLLKGRGADYHPFWIANTILVRDGTRELARKLAARPEVRQLHEARTYRAPEPPKGNATNQVNADVAWGVANIHADEVWDDFDARGGDLVVANIDTGVQFDHPALVDQYRGNGGGEFDHAYNWFDPSEVCDGDAPCDGQGHGTHTMGTMVGDDGADRRIGVAPEARWIAAKGCETRGCSSSALLSSAQWMLAPTDMNGADARPELRPNIVNNSWGANTGPVEDPWFNDAIRAWNASGIFSVFSNGNTGHFGCNTAGSPADAAVAYAAGGYDVQNKIYDRSSRGPGEDGDIKPDISAPGVSVPSSVPGDAYAAGTGTSMAAPHVSGTVALMWSAAPALVGDIETTRAILDRIAIDTKDLSCGGTAGNNNVWGEGRLDAYAAVDASPIGATGTLTGVVTDAETGEPIQGATVHAIGADYELTTTTDADGNYELSLVTGTYEVNVSAYGYEDAVTAGVEITGDTTTTRDFAMDAVPFVTVSGEVTDSSGHGWPLYARLTVVGAPGDPTYTDPATGRYEIELPVNETYTVRVRSEYPGYERLTNEVEVGSSDVTRDFELAVTTAKCKAPGYTVENHGLDESFDSGNLPEGWSNVTGDYGDGWQFDDPGGNGNLTGGAGGFAVVDSTSGGLLEDDSRLVSPRVDLSGTTAPVVSFQTDFANVASGSASVADVDLSVDGGQSWRTVWSRTNDLRGPHQVHVPIPDAAGRSDVRVRFRYHDGWTYAGWWQVDEVLVGTRSCAPAHGGLVVGTVNDDYEHEPVNGATVRSVDKPEERATTTATPEDPNLGGGFYWMFSSLTGESEFTARHDRAQYEARTRMVDAVADGAVRADFALGVGDLEVTGTEVSGTAELGEKREATLTVENVGTGTASFQLAERRDAFDQPNKTLLSQQGSGAPLRRYPSTDDGGPIAPNKVASDRAPADDQPRPPLPPGEGWNRLPDMLTRNLDTLTAVHDGKLCAIGGGFYCGTSRQLHQVYDIGSQTWSRDIAPTDVCRSKPAGGFIDGKLYAVGGWARLGGATSSTLIYNPESDSWSRGAEAPVAVAAAGHTILDGKLYVIGGRNDANPKGTTSVSVYDPKTDSWSTAADYPVPAAWQSCGTVDGLIYCAGGRQEGNELSLAYAYSPDSDSWFRIADVPKTFAEGAYTAANGLLLLSGGVVGGYRSNEGFYYDPSSGEWGSLPNSRTALTRGGSACGFYKIGGSRGTLGIEAWVEQLPGFEHCDSAGGQVPWLSADDTSATLEPGESTQVTVTLDASFEHVDQPGEYSAELLVLEDTPDRNDTVDVTLKATPPPTWGMVAGTVTGEQCDGDSVPIENATVRVDGMFRDHKVQAGKDGNYAVWTTAKGRPVEVTVSAQGWSQQTESVKIKPRQKATEDFALEANTCD